MPMLSRPILQAIAHRNRWANCIPFPSESGPGGPVRPPLHFTNHLHLGTLLLDFDAPSSLLLPLDPTAPDDLAADFLGWPLDGTTLQHSFVFRTHAVTHDS